MTSCLLCPWVQFLHSLHPVGRTMINNNKKIDRVISEKLLQLWGQIPNPDRAFLSRNGRSPYQVLNDLS
ncbi:MAG: hypothetical protein ACRCVW_03030, partial [Brevinema sp.]